MTIFYKDRLRSDKIYQLDKLLVRTKPSGNVTNEACLVMSPESTVDSFVTTSDRIAFYPNAVKKVYFPNEKILLPAFTKIKNNSIRDSNFNELKSFRYNFNKLLDLAKLPDEFLQKPILIDVSMYRDTLNKFAVKNRKTPIALIGTFTKILEDINELSPSKLPSFMVFEVNAQHDTFLAVMRQAIMSKPAAIMPLLAKLNILFVTHNNYYYKPDFTSIKDRSKILNLLRKITDLATDPNATIDKSGDIEIPKEPDTVLSDEELKAVNSPNEVEHDENDKEQTELHADTIHDNDDSPLESSDDPLSDDDPEAEDDDVSDTTSKKADSNIDLDDEDNTDVVDDILGGETSVIMGSTEIEMERIRKENEEFLSKNMEKQTKALKDLEAEADRLAKDKTIDPLVIEDDSIISKTVKSTTLTGITKSYYQKQFKRDVLNSLKVLNNDPEFPVVITKMEINNKSTPLSKLDEYRIEFLDKKYKRHSFIVDVPKLSHDGFLLINGSRKFIAKQATPIPVIKETHDRVQITTNYRKTFLYRKGDKTSGQADRVLRLLTNYSFKSITKTIGNSVVSNMAFRVSIPYNYLAKKLYSVKFSNSVSDVELLFNQENLRKTITDETKFTFDEKKFSPIGFQTINGKRSKLLLEEITTRKIHSSGTENKPIVISDSLVAFLTHLVTSSKDDEVIEAFKGIKQSLKLSYTEIKIVSTSMALGVLIAAYKGLLPSLDLYKVKYRVEEKRVAKKDSEIILAFKDVYLYIDSENDPAKEILVNGLLFLNTAPYSINDTYTFAPIYLDYLQEATGSRNTAKALSNFEHSMIDPITLENLIKLNFPTNFPELLLYGNSLLGELTHNRKNDMNHFRIRDSEVLSVAVYNTLMDSFNNYKRSMRSGVVQPISVKRDTVIKAVQSLENVEDYSTLNPFLEAEIKSKTTFKGPSGLNSSDAYTAEIRSYDKSMLGLYGIYTPIGPEVGVNRSMVLNPKIESTRGYIQSFDIDSADATNLFSIGELLNVFTPKHADSPRCIMATVQGKHLTPTKVQHPYLVGNGTDRALGHLVGQEFCFKSVDDGVIESINAKTELVTVKYKDGQRSIINLKGRAAKNSGGGFFTENRLQLIKGLKVGSKVKKGQILAIDDNFFKETLENSVGFAGGLLTKIAVAGLPETFEDSAIFTQKVVNDLSSEVINERRVVLSKNSRIIKMAQIGDKVTVNDPLIIFEDVGSDESLALKALEKLDTSTRDTIEQHARSAAKAKFTGEIFDIQIFYNAELEDMHPTLKAIVDEYIHKYNVKAKVIEKGRDDEIVHQPSTDRIESEKIMGDEVDGVLIQFFIKHVDKFKVGDKACFAIALKAICAETIEEGLEPYSEYRPEEHIDGIISPLSLVSRMVPDLFLIGFSNKVILELENQVIALLEE